MDFLKIVEIFINEKMIVYIFGFIFFYLDYNKFQIYLMCKYYRKYYNV